ncbi:glycolate oxidase subunit GlcF [Hahella sp. CR1]|uniref:glycolate oxidase subunit GlcF n=1 Tax=Hahella sp. CR1 TaxID=2992807 RepID=UPI002441F57F|nr:glycolate oxidase subunit GlcF [Hahella sp. CR1]MDG9670769.1 glycolate oxidase subunit GlcF [Hahella sp. CR1]
MKTEIHAKYKNTPEGDEAEKIIRSCVHCGFCNATCPTYQELSDERDGPRGRIYLIKQMLETDEASESTRLHLDRCLTCRSCETTCPSGVEYGKLLDIGRGVVEKKAPRTWRERLLRKILLLLLPYPQRFGFLIVVGQWVRPALPEYLRKKIPEKQVPITWPPQRQPRVMMGLHGCAQSVTTPNTNAAAARVLDRLGVSLIASNEAGCCGAVSYHLGAQDEGKRLMKKNIDAWWPAIESGLEAIVITASGCGELVKEYGHILKDDPEYAEKAHRVSKMTRDLSEVVAAEDLSVLSIKRNYSKIAVHCPCTLQHGQKLPGIVEKILTDVGFDLASARDKHLCCGSAGAYSLLQPKMSRQLLKKKVAALVQDDPDTIVTANVGCQLHLASEARVPVRHWIEIMDEALG